MMIYLTEYLGGCPSSESMASMSSVIMVGRGEPVGLSGPSVEEEWTESTSEVLESPTTEFIILAVARTHNPRHGHTKLSSGPSFHTL